MAIISLRTYNLEIEGMIDNGQLDEAVAHCRNILTTFPKHIATYRLLGKAHLEQQRISDATDIFQRVLSAIPDDFIANVGMSIIREDENNLDAAIWHMELAYEAQPANVAIQDELRRLYGRRDGMQPPRVRLTRGALARMYAKGGLFEQAIGELRAAIAEDPNRQDLQLLLGQMFFQASMHTEAVEACMSVLKKLPMCLEANRILAVSLPAAENMETVRNSRQIVVSMDPYYAYADPEAISSDLVPENAVNVEKLEYKSVLQGGEVPEQPAWATSLGISMEKPAEENLPEWLKNSESPAPTPSEKSAPSISPFIWDTQEVEKIITDTSKAEPELPDWMKDAGWKPSAAEAPQAGMEPSATEQPEIEPSVGESIEKADIPDWLQGIAPEGISTPPIQEAPAKGEQLTSPWLEPHEPGPTDSIIQWLDEKKPEGPPGLPAQEETPIITPDEEIPEWLRDLDLPQATPTAKETPVEPTPAFTALPSAFMGEAEKAEEAPTEPLGESVAEAETLPAAFLPPAEEEEEVPEWLKGIAVGTAAGAVAAEMEKAPEEAATASQSETAPEQTEVTPPTTAEEAQEPAQPEKATELPITQPLVAAGAFIAAEQLARPEETHAEPAPTQAEAAPAAAQAQPLEIPISGEVAPSAISPEPAEEQPESKLPEAAGAFLAAEMLAKPEGVPAEEQVEEAYQITPAEAAAIGEAALAEATPSQAEEMPATKPAEESNKLPQVEQAAANEGESLQPEGAALTDAEAFAWLESLAAEQEAKVEEQGPPPIAEEVPPPEWVKLEEAIKTEEAMPAAPAALEQPAATPAEEVPDWIKGLGEPPAEETQVAAPSPEAETQGAVPAPEAETPVEEELPAWLAEMEGPEAGKGTLTQPEEEEWKSEEIPAWLKEITESEEVEEEKPLTEAGPVEMPTAAEVIGAEKAAVEPSLAEIEVTTPGVAEQKPAAESLPIEAAPAEVATAAAIIGAEKAAVEPSQVEEEAIAPVVAEQKPALESLPIEVIKAAAVMKALTPEEEIAATPEAIEKAEQAAQPAVEAAVPAALEVAQPAVEATTPPEPDVAQPVVEAAAPAALEVAQPPEQGQPEPIAMEAPPAPPVEVPAVEPLETVPIETVAIETVPIEAVPVEVTPVEAAPVVEPIAEVDVTSQAALSSAREAVNQGQPAQAAEFYSTLIRQNYRLEEIIKDLQAATYRFPINVDMWMTLGDAHCQTNDLQQALNAYTKAEELAR